MGSGTVFGDGIFNTKYVGITAYYAYENRDIRVFEDNTSTLPMGWMHTNSSYKISSQTNKYRVSIDLKLNQKHSLQLQADGFALTEYDDKTEYAQFSQVTLPNFYTYSLTESSPYQFNSSLNYNYQIDSIGQRLKFVADYCKYRNTFNQQFYSTLEEDMPPTNPFMNYNNANSTFNLYTLSAGYVKPFLKKWTFETGAKYYAITSNSQTDILGSTNLLQNTSTNEQNIGVYASLSAALSPSIYMTAGLRAERMSRELGKNSLKQIDTSQINLFSSFLINYKSSNNFSIGFSYSGRISRPSIRALDPAVIVDSLSNQQGNPYLESSLIHSFHLSTKLYNCLTIRLGYRYVLNPIYFVAYKDFDNPQVTNVRIVNGKNTDVYTASVIFDKDLFKWWSVSLSGSISTNKYLYLDKDGVQKNNNTPLTYFSTQNNFSLPWGVLFNLGFIWFKGSSGSIYNGASSNLFASIQKNWFNQKLSVALSANDILRQYITYETSVLNGNNLNVYDSDSRSITISISYKIGQSLYKYVSKAGNEEEQRRIR
jgi:hypothetical protein